MQKRYDQGCTRCPWQGEIRVEPGTHPPCPYCGSQTERYYIAGYDIVRDEIPGGQWIENLGPTPVKVYSKSELRHEMAIRGLEQHVKHVGLPGSDKSPNTQKWI